jgi:phosphoribosylglycinamide formyltransferase-1
MAKKRTAILISGRGSNMRALVEAARNPDYPAEIACVISNRLAAPGLDFAKTANIPTEVVDHKQYSSREAFDAALHHALASHSVELVCCAGFMRVMTPAILDHWRGRILNIHPSLLPAYKGTHTHERALADGVKTHGASVHFVTPELDSGPVIAQAAVPVLPNDTAESLSARVLEVEHPLYVKALALVASGQIHIRTSE